MDRLTKLAAENERLVALLRRAGIDPSAQGACVAELAQTPDVSRDPEPQQHDYARLLLDSMSEGFYVVDQAGLTVVCNAAMVRLLGFEHQDELLGRSLHEIVHHSHADGSHYPSAACPIYKAAREGIAARVSGEVFFRRDGTSFPVEYRAEPVVRDGRIMGAISTFVDITERLEAERQLRGSEQRLALAMEAGGIGIWDYAPQSGVLRWDDRVRALFGVSTAVPISFEASVAAVHAADRPAVEGAIQAAFDPAGLGDYDVRFRVIGIEDGKERWIACKGKTAFANGKPDRFVGVARDVSEEQRAEVHLRLMVNELNHRVKNSLAMVQAIAAQTLRGATDMEVARAALTERLVALARAHDVLTATRWEGADLGEVVALSMGPMLDAADQRLAVAGPPVALSPKAALAFSLALHELATNALKYGAFSDETGTVSIRWRDSGTGADRRLHMSWEEKGGPAVASPQRRGFGSKLIERGLAAELQGEVRIEFAPEGIVCTIDAPYPVPLVRSLFP